MKRLKTEPRRTALLAALLTLIGLAMSVAVARAATPTITDTTTPPAGHYTGACSGCHLVTSTVPGVPGTGVETPDESDDASEALEVDDGTLESDNPSEALEVDEPDDQAGGDSEGVSPDDSQADEQADQAGSADQADRADETDSADEHETVAPNVQERAQHDDQPSASQTPQARSPHQGDAGKQDGHHQAGGGSD